MRHLTKEVIQTEYAALVEIVRVLRAAGAVESSKLYALYEKQFPIDDFERIINVLQRCGQVKRDNGFIVWNRRAN